MIKNTVTGFLLSGYVLSSVAQSALHPRDVTYTTIVIAAECLAMIVLFIWALTYNLASQRDAIDV